MTQPPYGMIDVPPRSGNELFHLDSADTPYSVIDFWRWAYADLISNVPRGILAEYLVRIAVGSTDPVRDTWGLHDVITPEGITIQVKATAYLQSWFQRKLTPPGWDIARKRAWNAQNNKLEGEPKRHSSVYVFCLHGETDQSRLDPLNLTSWRFFVYSSQALDKHLGNQKRISLKTVQSLKVKETSFLDLKLAVAAAADFNE